MTAAVKSKEISEALIAEHGLTRDEYQRLLKALGRAPNLTELGIFSVMWSEHCSYKSSKRWLKLLPTEAPWVIQGPGGPTEDQAAGSSKAAGWFLMRTRRWGNS